MGRTSPKDKYCGKILCQTVGMGDVNPNREVAGTQWILPQQVFLHLSDSFLHHRVGMPRLMTTLITFLEPVCFRKLTSSRATQQLPLCRQDTCKCLGGDPDRRKCNGDTEGQPHGRRLCHVEGVGVQTNFLGKRLNTF